MSEGVSNVLQFPRQGYDPLLDKRRAANYLGVGVRTFERIMAEENLEPDRVRANGKLLFRLSELDKLTRRTA